METFVSRFVSDEDRWLVCNPGDNFATRPIFLMGPAKGGGWTRGEPRWHDWILALR